MKASWGTFTRPIDFIFFLTLLLLVEELVFTTDIAAVILRQHVFLRRALRFPGPREESSSAQS